MPRTAHSGEVDDRGERLDAEGAQVGDRERPALHLVRPECVARGRVGPGPAPDDDLAEPEPAAPRITGTSSPSSVSTAIPMCGSSGIDQAILVPSGVQHRVLAQRHRGQLDDELRCSPGSSRPGGAAALNWARRLTRFVASTVVCSVTGAVV